MLDREQAIRAAEQERERRDAENQEKGHMEMRKNLGVLEGVGTVFSIILLLPWLADSYS